MTTIAIRAGVVAFDSRVCEDDGTIRPTTVRKAILSKRHRAIYAGAGWTSEISRAFRALDKMATLPWERIRRPALDLRFKDGETNLREHLAS